MTELPEVVIKRIFEKLDGIESILHDQCKRISKVESANILVEKIWKKIISVVGFTSTVIGILVILD
ncbi:MAG: hypothetical protein OEM28_09035 [Nitrosopumilus sp.]|nr:hypothetical protein [Nitrosopumilus sp.]MDH3486909.1 hypothetical protein [Nitrosopumilus sp.]